MLVYPRLAIVTATDLLSDVQHRTPSELRARASTTHATVTYYPTGNRASEAKIIELQAGIREIADRHGFLGGGTEAGRAAFDFEAGTFLMERMEIVPSDAAEPTVWAFLTAVVLPDVARWRFPNRNAERQLGDPTRQVLRRLWWRAYIFDGCEPLTESLYEDELVQIMERTTIGGNPRLARALARAHIDAVPNFPGVRTDLMRDAAKRLLRLTPVVAVEALDDAQLKAICEALVAESASALAPEAAASLVPRAEQGFPVPRATRDDREGSPSQLSRLLRRRR
jgi:hypothetical protein